jgi:hypothetical protein
MGIENEEIDDDTTDEDAAEARRESTRTTAPASRTPTVAGVPASVNRSRSRATGVGAAPVVPVPAVPSAPPTAKEAPWTDQDAEAMWHEMLGGEHPRSLARLGITVYDVMADIIPVANPDLGTSPLDSITPDCSSIAGDGQMSPGEALRERVTKLHFAVSKGRPAQWEVRFKRRLQNSWVLYGKGVMRLGAANEISAARMSRGVGAGQVYPQQPPQYQPPAQPQQPPHVGYGAVPVQQPPYPPPPPQYPQNEPGSPWPRRDQQPSHDPEVSNLRAEVAGLSGAVREMMEFIRGDRRAPPPPVQAQPAPGVGAAPAASPWPRPQYQPRNEVEDLREELEDMRDELNAYRRTGVGGAPPRPWSPPAQPAAQPQHAPAQPPPPPPAPRGPNGEIWVESARAWCMPVGMQPAAAPAPVPQPAPPPPQQPAPQQVGVGAPPGQQVFTAAAEQLQGMVMEMQAGIMKRVVKVVAEQVGAAFGQAQAGLGSAASEPEPEPEPEDPKSALPWDAIPLEGTTLFGHPAKYVTDKETGKINWQGVVAENPGIIEKGAEILGMGAEALSNFAKKAASAATSAQGAGPQQLPAGVGAAQVVETIPPTAQDATARANGAGRAGGFPQV